MSRLIGWLENWCSVWTMHCNERSSPFGDQLSNLAIFQTNLSWGQDWWGIVLMWSLVNALQWAFSTFLNSSQCVDLQNYYHFKWLASNSFKVQIIGQEYLIDMHPGLSLLPSLMASGHRLDTWDLEWQWHGTSNAMHMLAMPFKIHAATIRGPMWCSHSWSPGIKFMGFREPSDRNELFNIPLLFKI